MFIRVHLWLIPSERTKSNGANWDRRRCFCGIESISVEMETLKNTAEKHVLIAVHNLIHYHSPEVVPEIGKSHQRGRSDGTHGQTARKSTGRSHGGSTSSRSGAPGTASEPTSKQRSKSLSSYCSRTATRKLSNPNPLLIDVAEAWLEHVEQTQDADPLPQRHVTPQGVQPLRWGRHPN